MKAAFDALGRRVAAYLLAPRRPGALMAAVRPERLAEVLRPGDVLLVEGHTRVSGPIKYMTQSNWSHAALYVGPIATDAAPDAEPRVLIEAHLLDCARAGAAVHARPPAHPHLPPGRADAGRGRAARSRRHGVPGPAL